MNIELKKNILLIFVILAITCFCVFSIILLNKSKVVSSVNKYSILQDDMYFSNYTDTNSNKKVSFIELTDTPTNSFERGICLDRTTKSQQAEKVWNKLSNWPIINDKISSVRTYSYYGSRDWIVHLLSNSVKVFIGMDTYDSNNIDKMCNDLQKLSINSLNNIIGFSVANEPHYTDDNQTSNIRKTAIHLRNSLKSVFTNIPPITACFVTETFNMPNYRKMFTDGTLDTVVCSNIYGSLFSNTTTISATPSTLKKEISWTPNNTISNQIDHIYKLVKNIDNNLKLWITEIGWTSKEIDHPATAGKPATKFASGTGWASNDVYWFYKCLTE
jgi:hypothetical protein